MSDTRTVYLMTMQAGSITPQYHGQVTIDDGGLVNGETPVEDFGYYYMSSDPFPFGTDEDSMFSKFMDLIRESEGPDEFVWAE